MEASITTDLALRRHNGAAGGGPLPCWQGEIGGGSLYPFEAMDLTHAEVSQALGRRSLGDDDDIVRPRDRVRREDPPLATQSLGYVGCGAPLGFGADVRFYPLTS